MSSGLRRTARRPSIPRWLSSPALWLATSLATLAYALWPTFGIRFAAVDDHEIVDIIGRGERLAASRVLETVLTSTDEPLGRFRPLYWVGRALESATAGQSSTWWYVDRFLLAAITVTAIYVTIVRFVVPPLAALIALLPIVGIQSEVWTRLGPNEAYAMPLLVVGVAIVVRLTSKAASPASQWLGYLFLLSAGLAKENFLFVSVLVIAWSGLHYGLRRWNVRDWLVVIGAAAISLLDLAAIAIKVRHHGDVYPQERSWDTSRAWLDAAVATMDDAHRFTTGAVAATLLCIVLSSRPSRRVLLGLAAVCVGSAVSQAVFYADKPEPGRYFYPVVLLSVVVWTLTMHQLRRHPNRRSALIGSVVVALALAGPLYDEVKAIREAASSSATTTAAFQENLSNLERQISEAGVDVVVLHPWESRSDTEPVLSLARYLTTRDDLTVMTLPAPEETQGDRADLNALLLRWSRRGFDRLTAYDAPAPESCVSIVFGSAVAHCAVALPPA